MKQNYRLQISLFSYSQSVFSSEFGVHLATVTLQPITAITSLFFLPMLEEEFASFFTLLYCLIYFFEVIYRFDLPFFKSFGLKKIHMSGLQLLSKLHLSFWQNCYLKTALRHLHFFTCIDQPLHPFLWAKKISTSFYNYSSIWIYHMGKLHLPYSSIQVWLFILGHPCFSLSHSERTRGAKVSYECLKEPN